MSAPQIGEPWAAMLSDLKEDWDNYGGKPIQPLAMETVRSFCTVPCRHGGIQLEPRPKAGILSRVARLIGVGK